MTDELKQVHMLDITRDHSGYGNSTSMCGLYPGYAGGMVKLIRSTTCQKCRDRYDVLKQNTESTARALASAEVEDGPLAGEIKQLRADIAALREMLPKPDATPDMRALVDAIQREVYNGIALGPEAYRGALNSVARLIKPYVTDETT
jgi:hypothetical protein